MTKYKRNNKTHKFKKDQLTYLDLLQNNYPYNSYDGWTMPTQQMQFNSGSFWQNPSLGQSLSQNTTLGLGQNNMYNLGQNNTPKLTSSKSNLMSSLGNTALGMGAGIVGNLGGSLLSGGKQSGIGNTIGSLGNTIGGAAMAINPLVGGAIMGGTQLIGGVLNAAFGSKLNKERIAQAQNEINAANSFNANASNFDDLSQQILSSPVITGFNQKDIGSDGWFSNKAKNKYKSLLAQKEYAENWVDRSITNAATNLQQQQMNNLLQNYAAYGGLLDMNNQYSDGGKIYIKPSKRGTFTAAAKKHGKGVQEFASQVLANKENYSPAMVKKANFARNAAKWHSFGGTLSTHGLDLSNGVTYINNGNTHENNKYEGVQMGVDSQGIPNLVEEGEVIFNDYVFSNRIPVPNAVRNKYKLRGTKDMTFADAAKKAAKESEERPNDPISQRGLEDIMNKLANEQEVMREQENNKRRGKQYAKGGKLDSLLDAYNDWVTNPYNTATTGFGEGLDVSPNQAASREKAIKNTIDYNKETDDLIARDNLLRYAPVFGSALGAGYGLLSKPNYSRADALAQFAENTGKITPITYEPIGNYLTYRPTDLSYQANRMAAQAGATRRNIMNTSGGNRANAIGSLLAADYNSQIAMGEALRQAEATNFARRAQVEEFNRATNQFNAEAALKAAIANQQARLDASKLGLSGYTTAMQMKDAIDAQRAKTLSANLTNLFESLGQIGEEQFDKNRLKWLERKGVLRSDYFDTDKYSRNNKKIKE